MMQSMKRSFIFLGLLITLGSVWGGCSSTRAIDPKALGPVPSTLELAASYNERIEPLDSFWARISIRAKGRYDDGSSFEEQGTGHLQIQRPGNISLTIRKLGELYFAYGSNSEQYWAINLVEKEHKTMQIGRIDQVSARKAAIVGMMVHPGQLGTLMGLEPIDLTRAGGTQWSPDGKSVGVSSSSPWGTYTLWIDPRTYHAVKSEAFDRNGSLIAVVSLTRYTKAVVPGGQPIEVPGKVEIRYPNDDGFVRIEISEPAKKTIRPMVFNPNKLKRAYRIDELIDLDVQDHGEPSAMQVHRASDPSDTNGN